MILASLLLPALKSAKDKVKGTVCAGNLKQIAYALNMYASDYNGYVIDTDVVYILIYGPTPKATQYQKTLCPYLNCPPKPYGSEGGVAPVARCPLGGRDGTTEEYNSLSQPNFSYSLNKWFKGTYPTGKLWGISTGEKLIHVKRPSKRLLLAGVDESSYGAETLGCALVEYTQIALRHNNGNNILFCDGSVIWWSSRQIASKGYGGATRSGSGDGFWYDE